MCCGHDHQRPLPIASSPLPCREHEIIAVTSRLICGKALFKTAYGDNQILLAHLEIWTSMLLVRLEPRWWCYKYACSHDSTWEGGACGKDWMPLCILPVVELISRDLRKLPRIAVVDKAELLEVRHSAVLKSAC